MTEVQNVPAANNTLAWISYPKSESFKNFITEAGKGEVLDEKQMSLIRRNIGEEHPCDYSILESCYLKIPIVFGSVNKTVDATVGPGFKVLVRDNEQAQTILNMTIKDWNFDILLRQITRDLLIYGTAFLELVTTGTAIEQLKSLTPKYMYVKRTATGDVEGYSQWMGNVSEPIHFTPSEILQFNFNVVGNKAYGTSIIAPLLRTLENQLNIERISTVIFSRKANAAWHVKVGGQDGTAMYHATQADLDNMRASLEDMRENQEWVTNHLVEIKTIESNNKVMDPTTLLKYNQDQEIFGLEVPIVLLGQGNVPEGLAKEQAGAFERRITSIQQSIEQVLETQLFKRVLESNGIFNVETEFEWRPPSKEDNFKEIEVLKSLLNMAQPNAMTGQPGILGPDFAAQIISRIKTLLGFDETTEEEDKENELEAPQPRIPTATGKPTPPAPAAMPQPKKPEQEAEIMKTFIEEKVSDDMPVQEWVGFNFNDFKAKIKDFIDSDDFLKREFISFRYNKEEDKYVEFIARYDLAKVLNKTQARQLREILKDAFDNNESIRTIAKQIENKVKPPALEVTAPSGAVFTIPASARALIIARTETIRSANNGALLQYEAAGIEEVEWQSAGDERTCEYCDEMDTEVMTINEAWERIPAHVMCRCAFAPVVKLT